MDDRFLAIAEHLLLIERELRQQGWWQDVPPSAEALASVEPFSVDTLDIIEQDLPLPNASGILAMAEMVYADRPDQSRGLRASLARFDELIGQVR
jgi:uncharacterized protein YqcC (DUF446 family)